MTTEEGIKSLTREELEQIARVAVELYAWSGWVLSGFQLDHVEKFQRGMEKAFEKTMELMQLT